MQDRKTMTSPDLWTAFEYQDRHTGEQFGVSLATLLQCVCIAEQLHAVPQLEADWEALTIPSVLRERANLAS
jgi:hypothetical protein